MASLGQPNSSLEVETLYPLGSGAYGRVHLVLEPKKTRLLARKTIDFAHPHVSSRDIEREYNILSSLHHPNIVRYVGFKFEPGRKAELFMEPCLQGSLAERISYEQLRPTASDLITSDSSISDSLPTLASQESQSKGRLAPPRDGNISLKILPETYVWLGLHQLASALVYCHEGLDMHQPEKPRPRKWDKIIHRDIKPANIFITHFGGLPVVKLGDFGLAAVIQDRFAVDSYVGTPQYMAPAVSIALTSELVVFKTLKASGVLYEICTLNRAFDYRMDENDPIPTIPEHYSDMLRESITNCFSFDPEKRPTALTLYNLAEVALSDSSMRDLENTVLMQTVNTSYHGDFDKALHTAIAMENKLAVQRLLELGASCEATGIVVEEAITNREHVMQRLDHLKQNHGLSVSLSIALDMFGTDINEGEPALTSASRRGCNGIVRLLLEHGADPQRSSGPLEYTALHKAARNGHNECVQLLLLHGAYIEARVKDKSNMTSLHLACQMGHIEVVQILLRHGANTTALAAGSLKNTDILTPLTPLAAACNCGHEDIARLLLENQQFMIPNPSLLWPLHVTLNKGRVNIVHLLLDHGADPDALLGETGFTAVQQAASNGAFDIVRLLRDAGKTEHDAQILIWAVLYGETSLVHTLLAGGLDVNRVMTLEGKLCDSLPPKFQSLIDETAAGPFGKLTLLSAAMACGYEEIAKALASYIPNWSLSAHLPWAICCKNEKLPRMLLAEGADACAVSEDGRSALSYAVLADSPSAVRLLVEHGADVNFGGPSRNPLTSAVSRPDIAMMETLLALGANPSLMSDGITPIGAALANDTAVGNVERIRILLDHGADPNGAASSHGYMPLFLAASNNNLEFGLAAIRLLLQAGADPNLEDSDGRTPLSVAQLDARNVLLAHGADPYTQFSVSSRYIRDRLRDGPQSRRSPGGITAGRTDARDQVAAMPRNGDTPPMPWHRQESIQRNRPRPLFSRLFGI